MFSIPRLLSYDRTKKALGLVVLFLIAFILAFSYRGPQSSATIAADQNKFHLSFQLQKGDELKLTNILSRLNLSPAVKQGVEFELDATSEAKLAYVSPVKIALDIGAKYVNFEGNLKKNLNGDDFQFESIKLPSLTGLAVLSQKSADFLAGLSASPEYQDWISQNVKSDGGIYLVVFGKSDDFAVIFKNSNFKIDQLKAIRDASGEPVYKEQIVENTNYGLLNLSGTGGPVLAIVTKDGWNIIASSDSAAKELDPSPPKTGGQVFPMINKKGMVVFALYYRNDGNNPNVAKYISSGNKLSKILESVASLVFTLDKGSFSGSISVK